MPSKICSVCKEDKDISKFSKAPKGKNLKYGVSYRCKECDNKNSDRWRKRNKERVATMSRENYLQKNYGISTDTYEKMVTERGGRCDCCGDVAKDTVNPPLNKLVVDHCHETGEIRGLLCSRCNVGIGVLGDTLEHAQKAVEYLKRGLK